MVCNTAFAAVAAYHIQVGDIDSGVDVLTKLVRNGHLGDTVSDQVIMAQLPLLLAQRRVSDLAKLIDRVSQRAEFGSVVVAPSLFALLDQQIAAGAERQHLMALLAIAAKFPSRYPRASAGWRTQIAAALDCRAAAIAADMPDLRLQAVSTFDRLWEGYRSRGDSVFSTGLCLYRLAPRLGRNVVQPAIKAAMATLRDADIPRVRDALIEAARIMGQYSLLRESADAMSVLARGSAHLTAEPRGLLLIDDSLFETTILQVLDATKNVQIPSKRISEQTQLIGLALFQYAMTAGE